MATTMQNQEPQQSRRADNTVADWPLKFVQHNFGAFDAGYLGIMNFPAPAQVSWRSRDGERHEGTVDIGGIFKDQLILHDVLKDDISEGVSILNPEIILEINDRTINVYMRARIPTKSLRTPSNPNSDFRKDLMLAWSKTY